MSSDWRVAPTNCPTCCMRYCRVAWAERSGRSRMIDPARVGELRAGGVEGLNDAIREKDQSVAGLQVDGSGDESSLGENAEWQAAGFEALRAAVGAANHRGIVSSVYIDEAAR